MVTLTDCVFATVRRDLALRLGVCEHSIRPETPLSRFLPTERRRAFWRQCQRELGLRFPPLTIPPALERAGSWLTIGSIIRSLVCGLVIGPKWLVLPLVICSTFVTPIVFYFASLPWATEHPELETFGDLSRWLLACNMKKFRRQFGLQANHDEIYLTIKAMLMEMGAEPACITPDASFTELLGS